MAGPNIPWTFARSACTLALMGAAAALVACGGGSEAANDSTVLAATDSGPGAPTPSASAADFPDAETASLEAQPLFHVAPVELDAPSDVDTWDNTASARLPVKLQTLTEETAGLPTRGLTLQDIRSEKVRRALGSGGKGAPAMPMASATAFSTYTPAQIRAAYGLPALPVMGANLTPAQAASLGAGQTIYIVDAYHDPNVVAELGAFNQKFGLPACTTQAIALQAPLPLPAASASGGCTFSVVYSTPKAAMTATAPAYHSGWATEIALDVQWAHATAPLARIVLIEANNANLDSLVGAVRLANAMGPGVVSMSFGSPEGGWMSSVDSAFTGAGMSYLAATGDNGAQVSWPAASTQVLAVGGTSLNFSGIGARSEEAWSGSGGGISQYLATPGYQSRGVPGVGALARRAVPDVAFNANPSTGQYIALMSAGSSSVSWLSVGGTSLATPQWAGLLAVANAMRAQAGLPQVGLAQPRLYADVGAVPGTYYDAFLDVTSGANGDCTLCTARAGFDAVTGLGSPRVSGLLAALSAPVPAAAPTVAVSAPPPAVAPRVTASSIVGQVGSRLAFQVAYSAPHAVSLALSGAPAGMTVSSSGAVVWAAPKAGVYAVTVNVTDTRTRLTGKGIYRVLITTPAPPVLPGPAIHAAAINGKAGLALKASMEISTPGSTSFSVSVKGVPTGASFTRVNQTLQLKWPQPVAGKYTLELVVKDGLGRTARATVPITIIPAK